MAQKGGRRRVRGDSQGTAPAADVQTAAMPADVPDGTGRYLVVMNEGAVAECVAALNNVAGLRVARTEDFESGVMDVEALGDADAVLFEELGIAVVDTPPDQVRTLVAATGDAAPIMTVEPERYAYAISEMPGPGIGAPVLGSAGPTEVPPLTADYLRGYRDAVNQLVDRLLGTEPDAAAVGTARGPVSEAELTWGLQATRVAASRLTGLGIKVAVLDTGMDLQHPDFVGRFVEARSFIEGEPPEDGHGHGTHCIGTACGPRLPGRLPRYGVAFDTQIFAGKVLSNAGRGADEGIIAGIDWAIKNGCAIISMSLGSRASAGEPFSRAYERIAQRALAAGALIVAAAGNDSRRPSEVVPVSRPANCPSIVAVGALDARLQVAPFSNRGVNPQGGQVDIAAPGVDILSSWPRPRLNHTISGTSMATPHVAGIAALFAEANPGVRGRALMSLLGSNARRLPLASVDVGAGLVQAP